MHRSESLSRLLEPKCMLARATIYLYYRFVLFNNVSISLSTRNEMRDWERGDSKYLNTHLIFSDKFSIHYCTSSLFSWVIVYIRGEGGGEFDVLFLSHRWHKISKDFLNLVPPSIVLLLGDSISFSISMTRTNQLGHGGPIFLYLSPLWGKDFG